MKDGQFHLRNLAALGLNKWNERTNLLKNLQGQKSPTSS